MLHDDGVLVIDKPAGMTSQQAVSKVKRILGVKKAGHAGTLDPMATGVLVVGIGRATRLLGYIAGTNKQYTATIRLGQATTTDDAEGEPVGSLVDATGLSDGQIAAAMAPMVGEIQQVPSAVSAIKVDGRRAYAMVRAGVSVELAPRTVRVSRFEVLQRRDDQGFVDLDVVVDCSTGTYIRALARDLGQVLGVGGHLVALRRTLVGRFEVASAVSVDNVDAGDIEPIEAVARAVFDCITVDEAMIEGVAHGQPLPLVVPANPTAVLSRGSGRFLALYRADGDKSVPVAVFVDGTGR